jgi:HD-GYP domain-containing protein (c-di-GMP phosphodiesterase class II)
MNTPSGSDPTKASHKSSPERETAVSNNPSYDEHIIKHLKEITRIGAALSVEKNIEKLLEMIVDEAKSLSNADGGTLYMLDKKKESLIFRILQNDSMNIRVGGTSGGIPSLPNVPLYNEGNTPNHSNVSSYVAHTGKTVNIKDVYQAKGFDFSGPREYDKSSGYRSKSMLVIPLQNHEDEIIGVLQLLNAQDLETGKVIAFPSEYEALITSLASQAAVALTNSQLIQNLIDLFYAFIKSIATAIDEKSPYTGGHITRVVELTMMIATLISESREEPFKSFTLNENEMEELRLAAWMHDIGKITTPEYIVDKATKLQTVVDRIDLIESRFHQIAQSIENDYLQQKIELLQRGEQNMDTFHDLKRQESEKIDELWHTFEFIKSINTAQEFMPDEKIEQLRAISQKVYVQNGEACPYLTEDELENLCIRKGTLTQAERTIIENHANVTFKILNALPFPKNLSMVPEYAAGHHEKLDGSGYPRHLKESNLPIQSRIMAIADIFEALTAKDRPYKKPMKLSQALKILSFMKKDRHIDPDIYDLVLKSEIFFDYAKANMNPDQLDAIENDA